MPPGRATLRSRAITNENDENVATVRMTRAKTAALNADDNAAHAKGALQSKKTTANITAAGNKKRAALGDLSNLTKADGSDGKKVGKVLQAKTQSTAGVHKTGTRASNRPAPVTKDSKKVEPAKKTERSGSGAIGGGAKRKEPSVAKKEEVKIVEAAEPNVKRARSETKAGVAAAAAAASAPASAPAALAEDEKKKKKVETKPAAKPAAAKPAAKPAAPPAKPEAKQPEVEFLSNVKDLDTEDLDDPLMVVEYANEIFDYLRDLETQSIPNADYMSHQDDLEWKTRGILIDWLIEVHTRFHLLPETLFLAVNIIDRFLSAKVVQLDRLQLVGITAMFIAAKYEEVLSPHVENFKKIADDGFSETEILSAERFILNTLNYDLSYPNPMNFLRRVSKADNYDIQSRTIGKYLLEISLLDHRFMSYRPSHAAAAAMYLARLMLNRGEWDDTLTYYSGYSEEEVEPVVQLLVDYLCRPLIHEAFFKKYASKKFLKASLLARQWAMKNVELFGIEDLEVPVDHL